MEVCLYVWFVYFTSLQIWLSCSISLEIKLFSICISNEIQLRPPAHFLI